MALPQSPSDGNSGIRVSTYDGPGCDPVIHSVPRPIVPDRGALIRIEACGVCGTDLHILAGHWPHPLPWPLTLGHELVGVIEEKGADLDADFMGHALSVGDRVMLPPLMSCGECYYCLHYPERANKCLNPTYYGRYIPFDEAPHLWGGWAEMVYVDLQKRPATKVYRLPEGLSPMAGSLTEPLACCIRALNRAVDVGGFRAGDTVVIQGSGPIGLLALVAAQEMGAGRVIVIGAPAEPRLAICRAFGAAGVVSIDEHVTLEERVAAVAEIVGGFGADLVVECSGHPSSGPEGIEMLRDGGTYVEMGQFTDAGSIDTNWHRICTKDITLVGSWAFTPNDIPLGIDMMHRVGEKYPWELVQQRFPFSVEGLVEATKTAGEQRCLKATIVPDAA
jgi:threonine dehydrogenase-like Zn-dependent dehydrogenase